ncbi:MAG: histidine kinase dimerization/phospho-acceptor domain-containing protein, partial [bacterium]
SPALPLEANPNAPPDVQNIMAFLKNDPDADTTRSAADIRQLANDSEKLAQLILRTVEIRTSQVSLAEGESSNELVVGCIRKVVDQITKDPALKTQKGRKQVKRSLLMLETSLLERLQIMAGETVARDAKTVISEVAEDLDLDALAGKYMKSQKASAKAKDKLSGLIDRVMDDPAQLEELHEKLTQEGLSAEGWRELTLRQQQDNPSGGTGEGANELKLLTLLLARLGDTITPPVGSPDPSPETIKTLVSETETHLAKLTQITENNIRILHKKLERETSATSLSRHEILRILAEIAQEISQPLTIITGAITLIRSLRVGPLTAPQGELLSMISESGKRMEQLIRSLSGLAGIPDALEPDQAILSAAYRVKGNEPIRQT